MITREQAIAHYKYGINFDIFSEPVTTYAQLAIEALEKQIPKKVTSKYCPNKAFFLGEKYCPSCHKFIGFPHTTHHKYCPDCGQALDWSE